VFVNGVSTINRESTMVTTDSTAVSAIIAPNVVIVATQITSRNRKYRPSTQLGRYFHASRKCIYVHASHAGHVLYTILAYLHSAVHRYTL